MEVRRKWAAAPAFSVRVDIELSFSIANAKIFVFSCCILVQREKLRECANFQKNPLRSVRNLENFRNFVHLLIAFIPLPDSCKISAH